MALFYRPKQNYRTPEISRENCRFLTALNNNLISLFTFLLLQPKPKKGKSEQNKKTERLCPLLAGIQSLADTILKPSEEKHLFFHFWYSSQNTHLFVHIFLSKQIKMLFDVEYNFWVLNLVAVGRLMLFGDFSF